MSEETQTNENVDPSKALVNGLKQNMPTIRAIAGNLIDPDRLVRLALVCVDRNPLLKQCTWQSVARAVVMSAEINLEIGSSLNHAYLVPRYNNGAWECELQISAYGFAELAYRSGFIKAMWWHAVYKDDTFKYRYGLDPILEHEPLDETELDADVKFTYAVAELMTGGKIFLVMSRNKIDRLKNMNPSVKKGKFSPWTDNYAEMACVKVVRALCKRLPKSKELSKAMSFDYASDTGDQKLADTESMPAEWKDLSDKPTETKAESVARRMGVNVPQNGKGQDIPFLLTLGMTDDEQRDFVAYCQGEGLDQSKIEADAKSQGLKTKEDLYKVASGALAI
jgi:recombination protein RecT